MVSKNHSYMVRRPLEKTNRGGRKERFVNINRGRWEGEKTREEDSILSFWMKNENPEPSIYRWDFWFVTRRFIPRSSSRPARFNPRPSNGHLWRGGSCGKRARIRKTWSWDLVSAEILEQKRNSFYGPGPSPVGRRRRRAL